MNEQASKPKTPWQPTIDALLNTPPNQLPSAIQHALEAAYCEGHSKGYISGYQDARLDYAPIRHEMGG